MARHSLPALLACFFLINGFLTWPSFLFCSWPRNDKRPTGVHSSSLVIRRSATATAYEHSSKVRRLKSAVATANHDTSPGAALVSSKTAVRAARVVLRLNREGGFKLIHKLVGRTVKSMNAIPLKRMARGLFGESRLLKDDIAALLGERAEWGNLTHIHDIAKDALWGLTELLTLGTRQAAQVKVMARGDDGHLAVLLNGEPGVIRLCQSDARENWGHLSSYFVSEGPPELLGRRLVAHKRSGILCEEPNLKIQAGDVLCLATKDRAAYLLIAAFDRLPDNALHPTWMHKQRFTAEVLSEAQQFATSLQEVRSVAGRVDARMQRLTESGVVQEFLSLAEEDETWREVLSILRPYAGRLYAAGSEAGGRCEGIEVSINFRSLIGLFVVVAATSGLYTELGHFRELEFNRQLPLYSTIDRRPETVSTIGTSFSRVSLDESGLKRASFTGQLRQLLKGREF